MSVHTCQPSPFGHLRRERHIEWLRRVSQKEWRDLGSPRAYDERKSPTSGGRGTVVPIQETCVRKAPRGCALTECAARKGAPRASENRCPPRARGEAGEGYVEVKSQGVQTSLPSQPERGGEKDGGPGFLNCTKTAQDGGFVSAELQLLAGVDQLCITSRDKSSGLSCSVGRSYAICTRKGKKLFVVLEETDCLCLHLCGPARSSCLRLHDQNAQEVLRFCRPYRMDVCCMACCLMEMRAFTAAGKILGTVRQR
ncbi:hypothetical protein NDU88_000535 [Pleurodeles waltl]|uniref:Phospholipid scramblase n=3 Tax=Pleurodeles waltl TaxID=8319 RepID=A0AAV7LA35_PLEWA|nr:hypothetical protein NDU88_000535 [Pleurodeles waltl]